MTREEKQKAIYILNNSAPVFPLTKSEEYNDYVQTIKQVIDWLEQEPILNKLRAEIEQEIGSENSYKFDYETIWQNKGLKMALQVIDKYRTKNKK